MKLVVLTQNKKRLLIDTNEVKNYKELYSQEDGSPFELDGPVEVKASTPVKQKRVYKKKLKPSKKS